MAFWLGIMYPWHSIAMGRGIGKNSCPYDSIDIWIGSSVDLIDQSSRYICNMIHREPPFSGYPIYLGSDTNPWSITYNPVTGRWVVGPVFHSHPAHHRSLFVPQHSTISSEPHRQDFPITSFDRDPSQSAIQRVLTSSPLQLFPNFLPPIPPQLLDLHTSRTARPGKPRICSSNCPNTRQQSPPLWRHLLLSLRALHLLSPIPKNHIHGPFQNPTALIDFPFTNHQRRHQPQCIGPARDDQ